ncbi:tRNA uracil 4-sulfurtransferase ThiI [Planococcus lenghuensis]|uniref:Probable tRNA sulfurtransferase n=1 Tax=Planococcus lenghuensis TaxID=2213202 RepID=A0A1Q2KX58_9BACL|nr:tRNA uracil 4-sulfurtransferase ThiI [Planococcus lenghuensis]AQQ52798.1 tRNA 4-thiouridine(8) synthase ThiI [Planococcus lenghuensis]
MKKYQILIRYGELSTKGRNRNLFIRKLQAHVGRVLNGLEDISIRAERDRMFVHTDSESAMLTAKERLPRVFGIQSFSPVIQAPLDMEGMKETAIRLVGTLDPTGKTFKTTVKRSDKSFPLETNELQREVGGAVLSRYDGLAVQMKKPDIELRIEVRKEAAYMSAEIIPGAGGLPAGSNGKAVLMLSGGIDSPVAAYQMLRRGVELELVHFFSPPFTNERAKQKVLDLAEVLTETGTPIKLHIIPFTKLQQEVHKQVPDNVTMTSTRRMMLRIADEVRAAAGATAIVTGESLGQVASQTLESMQAINAVTTTPVLRPLLTLDKLEIIEQAKAIGTYDISIRPFEDCCTIFTPASPKTKPKLEKVERYESFTDFEEMIQEAVKEREILSFPREKVKQFADLL